MFILSLTYTTAMERVEPHVAAHMAWVEEGYAAGLFVASGRKVPRTGGVILARGDRAAIDAFVARDPFSTAAVARYEVTEIAVTRTIDELAALRG